MGISVVVPKVLSCWRWPLTCGWLSSLREGKAWGKTKLLGTSPKEGKGLGEERSPYGEKPGVETLSRWGRWNLCSANPWVYFAP
jgi:hypothetical protein